MNSREKIKSLFERFTVYIDYNYFCQHKNKLFFEVLKNVAKCKLLFVHSISDIFAHSELQSLHFKIYKNQEQQKR